MANKLITQKINGEIWFKFNSEFEKLKWRYTNLIMIGCFLLLLILIILFFIYIMPHINLLKTNPCNLCENNGWSCIKLFPNDFKLK